jgi:hypothetical protein
MKLIKIEMQTMLLQRKLISVLSLRISLKTSQSQSATGKSSRGYFLRRRIWHKHNLSAKYSLRPNIYGTRASNEEP